eukprot:1143110-Pelagomonas_calceolata.AAC.1
MQQASTLRGRHPLGQCQQMTAFAAKRHKQLHHKSKRQQAECRTQTWGSSNLRLVMREWCVVAMVSAPEPTPPVRGTNAHIISHMLWAMYLSCVVAMVSPPSPHHQGGVSVQALHFICAYGHVPQLRHPNKSS